MTHLKILALLVSLGWALIACKLTGDGPAASITAVSTSPQVTVTQPVPVPTGASSTTAEPPTVVFTPTDTALPAPTETPAQPEMDVTELLQEIVQSDDWVSLGMDADQARRWEVYASSGTGLTSGEELAYIQNFVAQWQLLHTAAELTIVPKEAVPAYRVNILVHETGGPEPVLFAVVADGEAPKGEQQLFLIARDRKEQPVGLEAAPVITGLRQQISADGQHVEYYDAGRNIELLYADARKLSTGRQSEEILLIMFEEPYASNHSYTRSSIYPRYYFPVEGVEASFYTIESLLTTPQIIQMNEAFQLLDRPEFAPLKNAIFQKSTSVTIIERSDVYLGVTYLGTGVMQLNRRDLLGNKYALVGVLAHEGAHILQSLPSGGDACKNSLRREIGDRTVPEDFFSWDAEQVLAGIKSQRIGAYQAGFWVWQKLGVLDDFWPGWRELIRTGKKDNQWITENCK